jgi:chaperonin cofactor prefoldin
MSTPPKKNFSQSKTAEKVEQLERKIDTLIAQIQMLRSEFKELKEAKK